MVRGKFATLLALFLLLMNSTSQADIKLTQAPYHGWSEAFTLANKTIEVVVVPQIGRIMQMRFAGEADGPFWRNRDLDGRTPDSKSSEWGNFGGDKTWPAPQADWEKIAGRGWPPPPAFDSLPVEARQDGSALILVSPVDPHFGIRTERRIELTGDKPEMTVTTTYFKIRGEPVRVSIWIITQLKDPELVSMPLPVSSRFPSGYNKQSEKLPEALEVRGNMVTCRRSREFSAKIGSDAGCLIWVGQSEILEVCSPRESSGEFPDTESSAEIYTNPDPNAYVELELLGPLQTLAVGEKMSRKQIYRLHRRGPGPIDEQVQTLVR